MCHRSLEELEKHLEDHNTPGKVLPPEDQLQFSQRFCSAFQSESGVQKGTPRKKDPCSFQENSVENTIPGDKSGAWDKSKAESPVTKQDQISASELGRLMDHCQMVWEMLFYPLLQASEVAVSIKVSLNQGTPRRTLKAEKTQLWKAVVNHWSQTLHIPVENACNDLCHTDFQERKEQDCFNETIDYSEFFSGLRSPQGRRHDHTKLRKTSEQPDGLFCAKPGRVSKQFTNSQV